MKVSEEFVIEESSETVWQFFEQLDRVARCVPGVEDVTIVDADNSRVRVTQALGPMTATFDVKMRITARDPGRSMEFTAVGRSVRGAAGNVRATHVVRLEDQDGGSTRVFLDGDVALGGMLGSVGQKVVAKQASVVTQSFAQALHEQLTGGVEADAAESSATAPSAPDDPAPEPSLTAGTGPDAAGAGQSGASGASSASDASRGPGDPGLGAAAYDHGHPAAAGTAESRGLSSIAIAGALVLAILLLAIRWLRSRAALTLR
jgi:carbon monoxide dehydrogenase subunit G